jgi:hypothetical protein
MRNGKRMNMMQPDKDIHADLKSLAAFGPRGKDSKGRPLIHKSIIEKICTPIELMGVFQNG